LSYRHFIITAIETKKPHKTIRFAPATNSEDDLDIILSEIRMMMKNDEVMAINILRDCHSEASPQ